MNYKNLYPNLALIGTDNNNIDAMKSNRTLQEELWIHRYPTGTIFRWTNKRGKPLFRFVGTAKDAMNNDRVILVVEKLENRTYHAVVNDIEPSEYEIVNWM